MRSSGTKAWNSKPATAAQTAAIASCAPPRSQRFPRQRHLRRHDRRQRRRDGDAGFPRRRCARARSGSRLIANSAPVPMWVSRLDGKRAFVIRPTWNSWGTLTKSASSSTGARRCTPMTLDRHPARTEGRRELAQALCARGPLSPCRWHLALAALGIATRWGVDGEHVGFNRRRPRHYGRQARRDRAPPPQRAPGGPRHGPHA